MSEKRLNTVKRDLSMNKQNSIPVFVVVKAFGLESEIASRLKLLDNVTHLRIFSKQRDSEPISEKYNACHWRIQVIGSIFREEELAGYKKFAEHLLCNFLAADETVYFGLENKF